jgi:DNA repair exonuclease SbcCD ATPase subunit
MEIIIRHMSIQNFKGITSMNIDFDRGVTSIFGDNASGKTTVQDAFTWVLFDKDSKGKSNFQIKTLDGKGQEVHYLDHYVELILEVDGQPLQLEKTFKEKWQTKRGSSAEAMTGHETKYAIDGVSCQKKDFDEKIKELISPEIFQLVTDPFYFNEKLDWKKRRAILMEVVGDIPDADVIASSSELAPLEPIMATRPLDKQKIKSTESRKKINEEIKDIPSRIDELTNLVINPVADYVEEDIKAKIADLEEQISNKKAGTDTSELRRKKAELEADLTEASNKAYGDIDTQLKSLKSNRAKLEEDKGIHERAIKKMSADIDDLVKSVENKEGRRTELRNEFYQIQESEVQIEGKCPSCGQDLPADKLSEAKEKANEAKATKIEKIQTEGKQLAASIEEMKGKVTELESKIDGSKEAVTQLDAKITEVTTEIRELENSKTDISSDEIGNIKAEITKVALKIEEAAFSVDTKALDDELAGERKKLAALDSAKDARVRIAELKAKLQKLNEELERLDKELYLIDRFVVRKVELLEERINQKFKYARFKLFEEQINGGINEVCITLYEGVPYGLGLNTGAEINVGLDIINTLSEHHNIKAPVFLDNAEAVTKPIEVDSQLIRLVVNEKCKKLEVVHESDTRKSA